jgi:hypothetical protein
MEVPGEAVRERPGSHIGLVTRGSIALQSGRDVISVAKEGDPISEAAGRARESHART